MSAHPHGDPPPPSDGLRREQEGSPLDLSEEILHAESDATDIMSHLNHMSKELSAYQLRKRSKGQRGTGMPALASTFSSLGNISPPRVAGRQTAEILHSPQTMPLLTASPLPKTYTYHGPTQSIVHKTTYPEEDGRILPVDILHGVIETRVDRRRRLLRNALKRKLRRDRWGMAGNGIRTWRLGAGEELERKRMQERVKRNTDEVHHCFGVELMC